MLNIVNYITSDNYLQCAKCARVIPIYETEPEPTIKDSIGTVDNPFENIQGQVIGVQKDKKSKRKNKFKSKEKNDKDINVEIKQHGEDNVKIHYDSSR